MDAIAKIRQKAALNRKTIVLPEYNDKRTLEAVRIIEREGIAKTILLTPGSIDKQDKERHIQQYFELRKGKEIDLDAVKKMFEDPLFSAAMIPEGASMKDTYELTLKPE